MSPSLVLRLTGIAVITAVVLLARRSRHQNEGGMETFRYPMIYSLCALLGATLLGVATAEIFAPIQRAAAAAPLLWMRLLLYVMPWYLWLIVGMCAWGAAFLALHRVEIGRGSITVYGIRSIESIDPRAVRRFVEYRYAGLALYGESRKPLLRVSWLIQDYNDLFDLVRGIMPSEGVDYEVRGRFVRID